MKLTDAVMADVLYRHKYNGETLSSIGKDYDLTNERIRQIFRRGERAARRFGVINSVTNEADYIAAFSRRSVDIAQEAERHLKPVYSMSEFCKMYMISRPTLYRLIKEGRGPRTYKIGRQRRISIEAANEWIEKLERESGDIPQANPTD